MPLMRLADLGRFLIFLWITTGINESLRMKLFLFLKEFNEPFWIMTKFLRHLMSNTSNFCDNRVVFHSIISNNSNGVTSEGQ
jgi:hypothetical protein